MVDIMGNIQEQLQKSQERWKEIDELTEKLEVYCKTGGQTHDLADLTAKIAILLVKQLKPMGVVNGEEFEKEFEKGMKQIIDAFTGGK